MALLYKRDKKENIMAHYHVDDRENIVFIVKTVSGRVFGAFSSAAISKKSNLSTGKFGFFFKISDGEFKQYPIKQGKAMTNKYDQNYLIIGASDIRIEFGDKLVKSCFGIKSSCFNTLGD